MTVSAGSDDNGRDESVGVTHTMRNGDTGYDRVKIAAVEVTVTDDDAPAIALSETAITVTEGASPTATYTVTLSAQPTSGVEVQVARGNRFYALNKAGGTQGAI